jgi:hypothetical protein
MTVQTDMTARLDLRAAQAQFAALNTFDLLCEIDRGEHVLVNQLVVGGALCCPRTKPVETSANATGTETAIRLRDFRFIEFPSDQEFLVPSNVASFAR